jgi:plasmid stabilization system protein ParE
MDTVVQGGAELQPAGRNSEPSAAFLERTQKAQEDLLKIIEYLAQRRALRQDDKVAKQEIEAAASLCAHPVPSMSDEERQRVWSTFDALSHRITPATVEGLREYESHRALPWQFHWFLGALLIVTILIQIHTLFGVQTLNAIDARSKGQAVVYEQLNRMHEASPALVAVKIDEAGIVQAAERMKNPIYTHLRDKNAAISIEKRNHYAALYQWNALWALPFALVMGRGPADYWGCECRDGKNCQVDTSNARPSGGEGAESKTCIVAQGQVTYGSESIARALVLDLQILVLPVLYSALGAGVWIVRNHLAQVAERRQRAAQPGEIGQRILLGAVLGGLVGALYMSDEIKSQLGSLPLLGLAFIVGYNVEMVFSVLDRLIASIRHKGAAAKG